MEFVWGGIAGALQGSGGLAVQQIVLPRSATSVVATRPPTDAPFEELLVHARDYPSSLPAAPPHALHAERFPAPRLAVRKNRGVETCGRPVHIAIL